MALDNVKEFSILAEKYDQKLKVFLNDNNIKGKIFLKEHLDTYDIKDLVVNSFDIHPSELVHKIVAEQLLKLLEGQIERKIKGSKELILMF